MSAASDAAAAMAGRVLFAVSPTAVNSPAPAINCNASQSHLEQQMHMAYNPDDDFRKVGPSPSPQYRSITDGATLIPHQVNMNSGEQKRKRGRPRRYWPDGGMNVSTAQPQQQSQTFLLPPPAAAAPPPQMEIAPGGSASPTVKKARGRPRGSRNKKKQRKASGPGSASTGFVPHIVNVNEGEDISSKILSVSQNGPRAVCVLSANGAISHVTLRQAATSGGTATYEGRFDILSLSGSFMLHEVAGQRSRTGGLSVALAGPDGRVLGGSVAGLLIAASPSQVVVGCFEPEAHSGPARNNMVPSVVPPNANHGGAVGPNSSPSRGTLSESSGGPASPLNMSSGIDIPEGMSGIPWK